MSDAIQAHGGAGVHSDLPLAGFYAYARSISLPSPLPSKPEPSSLPLPKTGAGIENRVIWLIFAPKINKLISSHCKMENHLHLHSTTVLNGHHHRLIVSTKLTPCS